METQEEEHELSKERQQEISTKLATALMSLIDEDVTIISGVNALNAAVAGEITDISQNELTEKTEGNSLVVNRHCALCLVPIAPEDVKRCGKCHKRAYCSRECQAQDWKAKKSHRKGQGHKNWCGIEYGEEDVDWEVTFIEGKGKAVIAKRLFPVRSRILVDGFGTAEILAEAKNSRVTLDDLQPKERSRLLNHSCNSNSFKFPLSDELKIMVVFANRDIQKGEEICVNYILSNEPSCNLTGLTGFKTIKDGRMLLKSKYGIVCSPQCFCRDEEIEDLINESRKMDASILKKDESWMDANVDLAIVRNLLINHKRLQSSIFDKARLLTIGFRIAVQRSTTLKLAEKCIEKVCLIYSSILHPQAEFAQRHEKWMNDPSTHPDYLKLDKLDNS